MTKSILHMLFTGKHPSPFDVNMAVDAGFDVTPTYTDVALSDVEALVQDCIFSRKPKSHDRTALYFGGRDVNLAEDMLTVAQGAMFAPFQAGLCADPNGAYSTSAALVALVEHHLGAAGGRFEGARAAVLGGGPVGMAVAVLLAREGAQVTVARLTPGDPVRGEVDDYARRFDVEVQQVGAVTDDERKELLGASDVVVSTAKAGIQVVTTGMLEGSPARVLADANAVPPAGIEGVDAQADGAPVGAAVGVGALAAGDVKYKTQRRMLEDLIGADEARVIGLLEAFEVARAVVAKRKAKGNA